VRSPLLDLPGAVAGNGIDAPVAAHYGSFNKEQRTLEDGEGFVDLSHREVVRISGPDRLTYLHSITSQQFEGLQPGTQTQALILSPHGHVEHHFYGVDDGEAFTAHTEPGCAGPLIEFLERMKFMMRVEATDVSDQLAVCWRPPSPVVEDPSLVAVRGAGPRSVVEERGASRASKPGEAPPRLVHGKYDLVPREQLSDYAEAAGPACGLWAYDALRIARGEPRFKIDTDHKTIPNEVGWVGPDTQGPAVHLEKGCYRGQETVARVHTLGRPPRRLTLLHLDGTENRLPTAKEEVSANGKVVGFVGSSARHHELGPIALAMIKRNVPVDATLEVDGMPAAQEVIVDPDVGLHVRPMR
jgi:tRNA-modifying protein YgfZ